MATGLHEAVCPKCGHRTGIRWAGKGWRPFIRCLRNEDTDAWCNWGIEASVPLEGNEHLFAERTGKP